MAGIIDGFVGELNKDLVKVTTKWKKKTLTEMKNILRRNGKGDSRLIKNIDILISIKSDGKLSITSALPSYSIYVDRGRKKNSTPPPIRPIMEWIKRYKIDRNPYAVARNIGKNGIKATYFMKPLSNIDQLVKDISEVTSLKISKAITDVVKK